MSIDIRPVASSTRPALITYSKKDKKRRRLERIRAAVAEEEAERETDTRPELGTRGSQRAQDEAFAPVPISTPTVTPTFPRKNNIFQGRPSTVLNPFPAPNASVARAIPPAAHFVVKPPPPTQSSVQGKKRKAAPFEEVNTLPFANVAEQQKERKRGRQEKRDKQTLAAVGAVDTGTVATRPQDAPIDSVSVHAEPLVQGDSQGERQKRRLERKQRRKVEKEAAEKVAEEQAGKAGPRRTMTASDPRVPRHDLAQTKPSDTSGLSAAHAATDGAAVVVEKKKKKRKLESGQPNAMKSHSVLRMDTGAPVPTKKRRRSTTPDEVDIPLNAVASSSKLPSPHPRVKTNLAFGTGSLPGGPEQTEENARLLCETWIRPSEIKERVANHGMVCRTGTYSGAEVKTVQDAVDHYMRSHSMSVTDFRTKLESKTRAKRGDGDFFKSIASCVPYRPLSSVRIYLLTHHATISAKGPFSTEEDEAIIKGQMEGKSWPDIALGLERRSEDCRLRWRDHLSDRARRRRARWTAQEDSRLRTAINDFCIRNSKPLSAFDDGQTAPWTTISEMMGGTRSANKCREHWHEVVNKEKMTRADGSKLRWGRRETGHLLDVLATFPPRTATKDIDWHAVLAKFNATSELDVANQGLDSVNQVETEIRLTQTPWKAKHLQKRFAKTMEGHVGIEGKDLGATIAILTSTLKKGWDKTKYRSALSSAVVVEGGSDPE